MRPAESCVDPPRSEEYRMRGGVVALQLPVELI